MIIIILERIFSYNKNIPNQQMFDQIKRLDLHEQSTFDEPIMDPKSVNQAFAAQAAIATGIGAAFLSRGMWKNFHAIRLPENIRQS